MRARQRRYDLWGAFILTLLPAVGGGTLRDLLVGGDRYPPFILQDPNYLYIVASVVVLGALISRLTAGRPIDSRRFDGVMVIFDTIGMAAFTVIGAKVAVLANLHWIWVPICAALTCAGGGMLLDIVTGREPRTFLGEPYEEVAIVGGLLMCAGLLLADRHEHAPWIVTLTIIGTMLVVFSIRLLVVKRRLRSFRLGGAVAGGL